MAGPEGYRQFAETVDTCFLREDIFELRQAAGRDMASATLTLPDHVDDTPRLDVSQPTSEFAITAKRMRLGRDMIIRNLSLQTLKTKPAFIYSYEQRGDDAAVICMVYQEGVPGRKEDPTDHHLEQVAKRIGVALLNRSLEGPAPDTDQHTVS